MTENRSVKRKITRKQLEFRKQDSITKQPCHRYTGIVQNTVLKKKAKCSYGINKRGNME